VIKKAVIEGDIDGIAGLVKGALDSGRQAEEVLKELIGGMAVVGEKFERREYYVPETLLSAYAMQKGLDLLKPHLSIKEASAKGRVLMGAVEGDVHDIGLNLVAMFLAGAGFEVTNLGRDVSTPTFISKAKELEPDIIALSAMLSTTMEKMKEVVEEFGRAGIRKGKLVVVGGASTTKDFASRIGADGHAKDAQKAVRLCEELMREKR